MAENKKLKIKPVLKAVFASLLLTFLFILIIAAVCRFGNVSEKMLGFLIFAASAVSVFLSCLLMTRGVSEKGFLYGLLSGLGYFIIIFVASVCTTGKFSPSMQSITMLFGALAAGMLGGIVGVNKGRG